MPNQNRQLAAIMFTDIVGYTALMGKDEDTAYKLLKKNRQLQKPLIEKHGGKWLKEMGDGVLASFTSVSSAVYCAIEIQKLCKDDPDLSLRIGIHQGEVIVEEGDVFGDGVNIASRIEPLAPAGSIYLTETVYRNIENKKGIKAAFVSEEILKNVNHPIRIYAVDLEESEALDPEERQMESHREKKAYAWLKPAILIFIIIISTVIAYLVFDNITVNKAKTEIKDSATREKSIAVLPFADMSPEGDQEWFSDGMMEEILNHLVRIHDLMVISRTSAMCYKGSNKSIQEIGKELGVFTILEGSVRKHGNKIRITVQLIDVETDYHLWSATYDRNMDDVFAIQSDVAQQVAASLQAEVEPEVKLRIESQPTNSTEAYDLYLEGKYSWPNKDKSVELYKKAIQIDPDFADAYQSLGFVKSYFGFSGSSLVAGPQEAYNTAMPYYQKALELDPNNAETHGALANVFLWYKWDFEKAEEGYKRALNINPNSVNPIDFYIATEKFQKAEELSARAIKVDPLNGRAWRLHILSLYFNNQPEKALWSIEDSPFKDSIGVHMVAQRVFIYLGMFDQAIETGDKLLPNRRNARFIGNQAIAYYHTEQFEKSDELIDELMQKSKKSSHNSPAFYLAMVYAQMGEIDNAFKWLEKAYNDHEVEMYWLKVEPPFESLRSDPRYLAMLDKVGFP